MKVLKLKKKKKIRKICNKDKIPKTKIHKPKHNKHHLKYITLNLDKFNNRKNGKKIETIIDYLDIKLCI